MTSKLSPGLTSHRQGVVGRSLGSQTGLRVDVASGAMNAADAAGVGATVGSAVAGAGVAVELTR